MTFDGTLKIGGNCYFRLSFWQRNQFRNSNVAKLCLIYIINVYQKVGCEIQCLLLTQKITLDLSPFQYTKVLTNLCKSC